MASRAAKKNTSTNRISSATPREAASLAQSATDKRPKLIIWPEWNDVDINAEKWDMAHKGKEKDKGKSPVVSHSFDDPEGKIEMPPGMKVDQWKRPPDFITENTPVVIDPTGMTSFDLIKNNEHLHESELMRYIVSQITTLWEISVVKNPPPDQVPAEPGVPYEEISHTWRPWEHIYTMNKVQKGPHIPPYNPYGKYAVRLYWMGCWRKVIVDDSFPFDEKDRLMLPCTIIQHELWPMLLTKALIKVASLDYTGGNPNSEFGDVSIINCLTGWLPEAIPIQGFLMGDQRVTLSSEAKQTMSGQASPLVSAGHVIDKFILLSDHPSQENSDLKLSKKTGMLDDIRYGHINEIWELLKGVLPEFKLPLQEWEKALLEEEKGKKDETASADGIKDEKLEKDSVSKDGKLDKPDGKPPAKDGSKEKGAKDAKEKEKAGKDNKDKKGDKDKDKKGDTFDLMKRGHSRLGGRKTTMSRLEDDGDSHKRSTSSRLSNRTTDTLEEFKTRGPSRMSVAGASRPCLSRKSGAYHSDIVGKKKRAFTRSNLFLPLVEDVEDPNFNGNLEEKTLDDAPIPEHPEVVIFASYWSTPKYPVKVSVLGDNADASERLRQNGLSHLYPHAVLITQTRSCPLDPPPPPEKIPAWKLIRPRKKKAAPLDEPVADPKPIKPIQCLEITSPFVNYKVSPVPIPTDTHRPKSSLERGGTRSRPGSGKVAVIEETDENATEVEPVTEPVKDDIPDEPQAEFTEETPQTPSKGVGKTARKSAGKRELEVSPKLDHKPSSKALGREHTKSFTSKPPSRDGKHEEEKPKGEKDNKLVALPATTVSTQAETSLPLDSSAGGLAPPPENSGGDVIPAEGEVVKNQPVVEEVPKYKKKWMDFEQFCRCFKVLYIYHKPNTYPCSVKHSDLKIVAPPPPAPAKGDKKLASNATGAIPGGYEDKAPYYLFVDNLQPTEIVVSFSSLSRWPEPPPPPPVEEKKSHTSIKGGKDKVDEKEATNVTSVSQMEGSVTTEKAPVMTITPGTLVAEPYSWKSLVTGQPILRLRTTAIRAAVLCLPAGRHVLKFMMTGPLGYHVHLCSSTQFVFGDEETVMAQLTKESCRFVDNASQVINSIGKCINAFGDQDDFNKAWKELTAAHCPYLNDKLMSKQHHFKIFNEALYMTLRKELKEIVSPEIAFAWRAFLFDATSKNILSLASNSRPATGHTSHRGSAKPLAAKAKQPAATTDGELEKVGSSWDNRTPTADEQIATVKLQRLWRGYWVRKIITARKTGTEENTKVLQNLQKCWAVLEQNMDPTNTDNPGLTLFRNMFKLDPDLMVKYPFYKDEWNKISYNDYKGQYPDQPANNWFIVFREVFHVTEEMLAVPKLYVPISTCMLRVINNDTGEEIPRVFQKVAPFVYKRNRKGYTFVAEARTTDQAIMSGTWRMRMIASLSPLPAPLHGEVNSSFHVKEIRDYYLPNSKNIIFRYAVKVAEDHLTSIQINTSKTDVHIKLMVLNNEEEVASTLGKGHAVIPAFTFLKDINHDDEPKRSTSRSSNKGEANKTPTAAKKGKRGGSGKSNDGRQSSNPTAGTARKCKTPPPPSARSPMRSSQQDRHSDGGLSDGDLDEKYLQPHKYIIQAVVLKDSWPLSESSWHFVQMLKEIEKNELKVAYKEKVVEELPKAEKTPAATDKGAKGGKGVKGGKDKVKEKEGKGSRPPSQQFDLGKPHWTFRIVSDANAVEDIEVKKDTERADEIRALKKAWEDAEPGRAVKAMQSRLKYLSTHTIKLKAEDEVKEDGEKVDGDTSDAIPEIPPQTPGSYLGDEESALTLEPPLPPAPKEILEPVDVTPFLRRSQETPRYLDEEEAQRKFQEQQHEIAAYKAFRQQVEQWREQDKEIRNLTKEKQLRECEELQAMLDAAREAINKPREAIRQKFLEVERKKLEELEAQEAKLKADAESKSPKGKKGSAKGKNSPGKKKK